VRDGRLARRELARRRMTFEPREAIFELLDALLRARAFAALPRPALHVAAQALDLALDRLDLPALIAQLLRDPAVLRDHVRTRDAADETRGAQDEREADDRAHGRYFKSTAWTRRLRAQQASDSSWQSGSSLP
jgi:hypothetical protein